MIASNAHRLIFYKDYLFRVQLDADSDNTRSFHEQNRVLHQN